MKNPRIPGFLVVLLLILGCVLMLLAAGSLWIGALVFVIGLLSVLVIGQTKKKHPGTPPAETPPSPSEAPPLMGEHRGYYSESSIGEIELSDRRRSGESSEPSIDEIESPRYTDLTDSHDAAWTKYTHALMDEIERRGRYRESSIGEVESRDEWHSGEASFDEIDYAQQSAPVRRTLESSFDEIDWHETESPRYTDLTIYEGHLYPSDDFSTVASLPDDVPLVSGRPYTLEVAIRSTRKGIDADRKAPRAVKNPREDKEELIIYVLAKSQEPGIEIEESFSKIAWAYDRDSESALFRLKVKPLEWGSIASGCIEVRLYDCSLDLLDIVNVSMIVVAHDVAEMGRSNEPVRHLRWPEDKQEPVRIDTNAPKRLLSIHISSFINGYGFQFLFHRQNGEIVEIPIKRDIRPGDLDSFLIKVRDFWTRLVISNYAAQLSVSRTTYGNYLNQLRDLGTEAWAMLFGSRYGDMTGGSEALGELLSTMELAEGARIQITYGGSYADFIFPWNILYAPTQDSASIDPLLFWGARYQIEQVTAGPKEDKPKDEPIRVLVALDQSFGNSMAQIGLFEKYQACAPDKLIFTDPIRDQNTLLRELVRSPSAHLIYFYCHGYATSSKASPWRPDGIQLLKQSIEALAEDSPERKALETLITLTARMGNESWIFIGDSEIKESKLKLQSFFAKKRPIVFLNMCQSADLFPTISSGLVRVFLDHNASAVLGTECPMTSVFAHAFSKVIFDNLFSGEDVGTTVWNARRYFLGNDMRNPLGLAYTLYGRGTARLGERPIVDATKDMRGNEWQT